MVTKELYDFSLDVKNYVGLRCRVPASVISVLTDRGILKDLYYGDNVDEARAMFPLGASFYTDFEVDSLFMSYKNLYLELSCVDAPLTVLLNGNPIASYRERSATYLVDVRLALRFGKNRLELRFDEREADMDDYISDIALMSAPKIIAFNHAFIDNVVISNTPTPEGISVGLDLSLIGETEHTRAVATLISPGGSVAFTGFNMGRGEMLVPSPELWWPGDMGAHSLYHLTVNLYTEDGLSDSYETDVGFSYVDIVGEGDTRSLRFNDRPFYPLGAVHVMEDNVLPWIDKEKVGRLISLAAKSGINTLYVKGRERLPSRELLSQADRAGIVLLIEMPSYHHPRTSTERRMVERTLESFFKGVSVHPSVAVIIGDGREDELLATVIERMLPNARYVTELGEVLPFGIPSLPELATIEAFCPKREENFLSPTIQKRCTSHLLDLFGDIVAGYRMPHSFEEFIYLTQLLSAKHAERYAISERLDRDSFGAIFDRLSDTIPKPSSSAIDYYLRPKALWYYARRFFAPVIVTAEVVGTRVKFIVSNLQTKVYRGMLKYSLVHPDLTERFRDCVAFVAECGATTVYECELGEVIKGAVEGVMLQYSISDGVSTDSYGTHYFCPMRDFMLEAPDIKVDITGTGRDYIVVVSSDKLAPSVTLDFGEIAFTLDDNCFDITSPVSRQIKLHTYEPCAAETLRRTLKVCSLYDIGRFK